MFCAVSMTSVPVIETMVKRIYSKLTLKKKKEIREDRKEIIDKVELSWNL